VRCRFLLKLDIFLLHAHFSYATFTPAVDKKNLLRTLIRWFARTNPTIEFFLIGQQEDVAAERNIV